MNTCSKICGKEFEESKLEEGICRDCLNDGEHYYCKRCGDEMIYTNRQKYIEKIERPKFCQKCLQKKDKVCGWYVCKNCGKTFAITFGQKDFFDSKGMNLPTRCENCRKTSKKSNEKNFVAKNFTKRRKDIWGVCTCKECGKIFEMTKSEMEYYKANDWKLPIRCKDCRNKK